MPSHHFDLIVAGGGPAGLCAAMQAGHAGLEVLLIEKSGILGGTTTLAGVNFPGLFHAWGRQVIAGYGWELTRRTVEESGGQMPDFSDWRQPHWLLQIPVNVALYAALADEMVSASGARTLFHVMPFAVRRETDRWMLDVAVKEGVKSFSSDYLIDTTGDANVAALAGFALRENNQRQPATLIFKLGGYDPAQLDYETLEKDFRAECDAGRLHPCHVGGGEHGLRSFLLNHGQNKMHVTGGDASTSAGKSEIEQRARAILLKTFRFLRTRPGLENVRIEHIAAECGIRETKTLAGQVTITGQDYVTGRIWPDSLCHSFYPIDIHRPDGDGIDIRPLPEGNVPTVPLAAMRPLEDDRVAGHDHFLCAGRPVSSDQAAHSALRVQATCMAMGQAAAAAVVIASRASSDLGTVDSQAIRALLREHGAITPDA